ncbi:MAG: hypothetical protein ACFFCS_25020 [Candidatus Hodarchaeota archaeon]
MSNRKKSLNDLINDLSSDELYSKIQTTKKIVEYIESKNGYGNLTQEDFFGPDPLLPIHSRLSRPIQAICVQKQPTKLVIEKLLHYTIKEIKVLESIFTGDSNHTPNADELESFVKPKLENLALEAQNDEEMDMGS